MQFLTISTLSMEAKNSRSASGFQLNACLRDMVKLQRAYSGCLGDERR
jgi:hypothetical protein